MSYFEGQGVPWQHRRQQSWDQSQISSRAGASPTSQQEAPSAFGTQFDEVARATDNLAKSGKIFGMHGRRDSQPLAFTRQYADFESRLGGPPRHTISDYEGMRSHSSHSSSSLQGYLANQRFGPRLSEAEQMMQAKRRAAAQRERELRNYHQEQQYNRHSGAKSDRSMSPSAMNEEDRRELIARQHRALYGNESSLYPANDGASPRPVSQDARVLAAASSVHASSSHPYDPFSIATASPGDSGMSMPTMAGTQQRSRSNSTSPSSNQNTFTMFDNNQQTVRTSKSSPDGSPPRPGVKSAAIGGVGPIGTRPPPTASQTKRNTPPALSPLGYGFSNERSNNNALERTTSAPSNPPGSAAEKAASLGWGGNSGPWGSSKNTMGLQASVWG